MTRSSPYFAEIRLILWQQNHRHGQAFYVHTQKTVQSTVSTKRGESPTQNAVVRNTVHDAAAFIGALAMKICQNKSTTSTCLSVRQSLCIKKKESDKWVFIILDTGHLIKSVHTFPLCLQPDIITDHTLYTRTHIRTVSILAVIPQIFIEAKKVFEQKCNVYIMFNTYLIGPYSSRNN